MLITIRIVIDVPKTDEENYSVAIENIIEAVRKEFPHLEVDKLHSPVTVFIKEISNDFL